MVVAMALRMGFAGYEGEAACRVDLNAGEKGQPLIVKGMVQQECGEMAGGGREEEHNQGRHNNGNDDNNDTAIAIAITNGAIEDYGYGLPCANNCLPKTSANIEDSELPNAKNSRPKDLTTLVDYRQPIIFNPSGVSTTGLTTWPGLRNIAFVAIDIAVAVALAVASAVTVAVAVAIAVAIAVALGRCHCHCHCRCP